MKRIFYTLTGLLFCFFSIPGNAQNEEDALRYSGTTLLSNARSVGIGNAFGAVGANPVSANINPAGLGLYRNSEFSFSTGLESNFSSSNFLGNSTLDSRYNLYLGEISLILNKINYKLGKPVQEGWVGYTFGLGLNRMGTYNYNTYFNGQNNSTILYDYAESQRGISPEEFTLISPGQLAWQTYLIDHDTLDGAFLGTYTANIDDTTSPLKIEQQADITRKGSKKNIYFSFAGNYSNKLFLGATVNIPTINFNRETRITENNRTFQNPNYKSSTLVENIDAEATGINLLAGAIYRVSKTIRLGASIQTPTLYAFNEDFEYIMNSSVNGAYYDTISPIWQSNYKVITPFRTTLSAAAFVGKAGFLSLDYTYENYALAILNSNEYNYSFENQIIKEIYGPSHQINAGTEWRYNIFYVRGGVGIKTSPYKEKVITNGFDYASIAYSGGVGLRENSFGIDFAYRHEKIKDQTVLYELRDGTAPTSLNELNFNNFIVTASFFF